MTISLSLPVYFEIKKNKTILVGMNWYRNAHYFEQNKVKQFYTALIFTLLPAVKYDQYTIQYTYHYKNSSSDLMNVCSIIDKFLQDALQSKGIVQNDTVKYCLGTTCDVGDKDKLNPKIEIKIFGKIRK